MSEARASWTAPGAEHPARAGPGRPDQEQERKEDQDQRPGDPAAVVVDEVEPPEVEDRVVPPGEKTALARPLPGRAGFLRGGRPRLLVRRRSGLRGPVGPGVPRLVRLLGGPQEAEPVGPGERAPGRAQVEEELPGVEVGVGVPGRGGQEPHRQEQDQPARAQPAAEDLEQGHERAGQEQDQPHGLEPGGQAQKEPGQPGPDQPGPGPTPGGPARAPAPGPPERQEARKPEKDHPQVGHAPARDQPGQGHGREDQPGQEPHAPAAPDLRPSPATRSTVSSPSHQVRSCPASARTKSWARENKRTMFWGREA